MWGQAQQLSNIFTSLGIIPTRVGTSNIGITERTLREDHPHARGDKANGTPLGEWDTGSSPRVWGQADDLTDTNGGKRIIPTRVGTRLKKSRKIAVLQNQPLRFPLTFHRSFV